MVSVEGHDCDSLVDDCEVKLTWTGICLFVGCWEGWQAGRTVVGEWGSGCCTGARCKYSRILRFAFRRLVLSDRSAQSCHFPAPACVERCWDLARWRVRLISIQCKPISKDRSSGSRFQVTQTCVGHSSDQLLSPSLPSTDQRDPDSPSSAFWPAHQPY